MTAIRFVAVCLLCGAFVAAASVGAQDVEPRPPEDVEKPGPEADADEPAPTETGRRRSAAYRGSGHRPRIAAALDWLRDHQSPEGHWSASGFRKDSQRSDAKFTGNVEFVRQGEPLGDAGWEVTPDVGLTAMAMMAFSAAGFDHRAGEYRATIRRALVYLRRVQVQSGCFGSVADQHFVYNHALATTAIADLYLLSGDDILVPMASRACSFILEAQNPGMGWRYGVRPGESDTSVTGVMVAALQTAKKAGIQWKGEEAAMEGAFEWFGSITAKVKEKWKTGYDTAGSDNGRLRSAKDYSHNATLDAIHGTCMLLAERKDENGYLKDFLDAVRADDSQPAWEPLKVDLYYWYWGSTFLYLSNDRFRTRWRRQIGSVLSSNQRGFHKQDRRTGNTSPENLAEHGSWDPVGAWGIAGGRVYSTAMAALILQTEWRVKAK